jgi:hypothetical protein
MSLVTTAVMAKKSARKAAAKAPAKPKGRPKGAGRITSRYAIVATPEYKAWMEGFLDHLGEVEVSDVFRDAVKALAAARGYAPPPKR